MEAAGTTYVSRSAAETRAIGEALGRGLRGGEVVVLEGDLGVGKTCLVQGLARGLGVTAPVVSPTFTLAATYEGRVPLVHYDLYRVEGEAELTEIGYLEPDDPRSVCVVEWGERVPPPPEAIRVHLELEPDGSRRIVVQGLEPKETP